MVLNWSGIDLSTPADPVHVRNDDLASAEVISGAGQDPFFSNEDYTTETGDPWSQRVGSAWYTFTPSASGTASLDSQLVGTGNNVAGTGTDTFLVLYTGPANATFADLTQVTLDDDTGGNSTSLISNYPAVAGQHYYVQLSMYRAGLWNASTALRWNIQ